MQTTQLSSFKRLLRLADRGLDFQDWYPRAQREIATVCDFENWSINRFVDILALTSPRCSIRRNVRITLQYLNSGVLFHNVMRGIRASIDHWTAENKIRGPKTEAFRRALLGDESAIVLDVHMASAFGIPQKAMYRRSTWKRCESLVRKVARELNLPIRDAQACLWAGSFRLNSPKGMSPGYFPILREYQIFKELGRVYPRQGAIDKHVKLIRRARYDARQSFLFS